MTASYFKDRDLFVLNPALVRRIQMLARLASVRTNAGFRAFVSIVDLRIRNGQSVSATRMLVAIGASQSVAYEIVEDWPTVATARLAARGVSLIEECSCWLASYVPSFNDRDWNALMVRATQEASRLELEDQERAARDASGLGSE